MRRVMAAVLSTVLLTSPAWPCGYGPDSELSPDELDALRAAPCNNICPDPGCAVPVLTYYGNSPFFTHPAASAGPVDVAGCFAVVRVSGTSYLKYESAGATFDRETSPDGLATWSAGSPVSGLSTQPWTRTASPGVQCPDPHALGTDGKMVMYYNVQVDPAVTGVSGWGIGRATSTDFGVTWTEDARPVVLPTATHFPYMPSFLDTGNHFLLAYAWVCKGSPPVSVPDIHVLKSGDQITWGALAVPAITTGACGEWDSGSSNRPRMLLAPNGDVYMFFAGYAWNPTHLNGCGAPDREYARIGVAVSRDGGATWCKAPQPILEHNPSGWNNKHVVKPTLTQEPGNVVRLYYAGNGSAAMGLGIAQTRWIWITNFAANFCPEAEPGLEESIAPDVSPRLEMGASPNPTLDDTTISLRFARAIEPGELSVSIYDVTGRAVRTLYTGSSETMPAEIRWDGRATDGARVAAGRYFVRAHRGAETLGTHWITTLR
ncbi:MAG: FlgD immunoglobulin-like domain containing protein [bacterium]